MSGIGSPEERYEQAHPEATAKEADDGMQVSEGGGVAGVPEALDISRAVREICEHLRVERVQTEEPGSPSMANRDRLIFVAEDGTETEISRIFRGVELKALYSGIWEATITTPCVHIVEVPE